MLKCGGGSIVNNASLAGLGALPEYGAYVMTKFAVVGLTKTIAAEFGAQNIRCNAVCPGIIATQMNDYQIQFTAEKMELSEEETKAAMAEPIAMKRFADAEEVADAVAYLAGPASGYITGVALPVAGGLPQGL